MTFINFFNEILCYICDILDLSSDANPRNILGYSSDIRHSNNIQGSWN